MDDGESPAWLEGGDATKATATSAAPSSLMSEDDDAPTASAAAARTGLDNASASTFMTTTTTTPKENKLLSKFGGKKKAAATDATPTAPAAPLSTSQVLAGEADLPKLILFMRLVNMAAAALLITTSVSVRFICSFRNIKGRRTFVDVQDAAHTLGVGWGKASAAMVLSRL
jgi:hypothetical protein